MSEKVNLLDLDKNEIKKLFEGLGFEKYRAEQVYKWLYKGIKDIDDITNLSKDMRSTLKDIAEIKLPAIHTKFESKLDETIKYLFELDDGNIVESVLMKYKYGYSVCISSQIGCRMGCRFCASTGAGFMRNLTSGEMIGQILSIQNDTQKKIGNIVIMGIGEPLDNYNNVIKFLKNANEQEGLNISYRRITVSTCGLVPEILKLAEEKIPINLSISLHAPNDEIRDKLMPVNKRYTIDKIIGACKIYTRTNNRRITFEYAMIEGVNDSRDNAMELAGKLKGLLCHVNLIPVNFVEGTGFKRTERKKIESFKHILERAGIPTTIRRELGEDINAACGQLRRKLVNQLHTNSEN